MKRKAWCEYLYWWVLQESDDQDKWQDVKIAGTQQNYPKKGGQRIVKRRRLNPDYDGHDETRPYEGRKGRIVGKRPL